MIIERRRSPRPSWERSPWRVAGFIALIVLAIAAVIAQLVHVQIVDSHGSDVLHATSRGPYMLVKLRPGHYIVHARYERTEQQRSVTVPASGNTKAAFYWNHQ